MSDSRTRILLVEDEVGDARLLRELLREVPEQPYEVTTVGRLAEAIDAVAGHEVILLDLSLPDASGVETITRMAAAAGPTPIVVLTGNTDDEVAIRAISLGAEDYLRKSELTPSLLARTVRYATERRRGLEARRQVLALEIARAESERSAARARFLAGLSGALGTMSTPEQILDAVACAVVPELADVCVADLALDGGRQRVASCGATELLGPEVSVAADDGTARAAIVATLTAREQVLGTLTLACRSRTFDDDRRSFAAEVAQRTAVALDNALLHRANQRALRAREEMLAVVSHDLRNPLAVLAMTLQLVDQSAETGHPLPAKVVTRGARAIDQMRRLIDDLLDVARIDSGTLVVARAPLDVAALVRDAADQHVALAGEKGLSLAVECAEGLHVDGDRDRLMQLVGNLLGNAIKFTPAGGRIALGCARRHDAIHVSVTDSGPGVPADSRAHVFDRFYQSSRRKDGVGLGLAIAKGIVDAHGGRIGVDGAEPVGARFWFDLPVRGAPRYVGGTLS